MPQNTLPSPKISNDWPSISKPDDREKHETLEAIKRLSKWISELETSINPRCQTEKIETPLLRKSLPLTKLLQPRKKLDSKTKQLCNLAEAETAK